jgi:Flp pilus assembly pilin Flp
VGDVLRAFIAAEDGADLLEYALLAGLLVMACFIALSSVGSNMTTFLGSVASKVATIVP